MNHTHQSSPGVRVVRAKRRTVVFGLIVVLAAAGGALLATPASAVPQALRFQFVEAVARSSTRAAVYAEQRGAGPVLELKAPTGTAIIDVRSSAIIRVSRVMIVPGIVTMTPTPTPTATNTPTNTPAPTATP